MSAIVLSDCSVKVDPCEPNVFVLCSPCSGWIFSLDEKNWRIILDQFERNFYEGNELRWKICPILLDREWCSPFYFNQEFKEDNDGKCQVYLKINRVFYGPRGDVQEHANVVQLTEADVCILKEFINECTKPETD